MVQPTSVFKDSLAQLPAIGDIERIDLVDGQGVVIVDIENKPGKQDSVAAYHYLQQTFDQLDATATRHGLAVFAEHTIGTHDRPDAHPNVNRLLVIATGEPALRINVVRI